MLIFNPYSILGIPYDLNEYDSFADFITANAPVWFTRKDVVPMACSDCNVQAWHGFAGTFQ